MRGPASPCALVLTLACMFACHGASPSEGASDAGPAANDANRASVAETVPFDGEIHRRWLARGSYYTLSSPRAVDLDGDGVLDIVSGHGVEAEVLDENEKDLTTFGSVTAHSGANGALLWEFSARQDIVGSAIFLPIDADDVPDVVIGGRYTELVALSGRDGSLLWRFFEGTTDEARAKGLYNFYSPLRVADLDGDDVDDLVAANGGDPTKSGNDRMRPAGQLLLLSGKTGQTLGAIEMPDRQETYMSPTLLMRDEPEIVFGSGGETIAGSLWRIPLAALRSSDASQAVLLASGNKAGFIAPCMLVDLTLDGIDDVVSVTFGAELIAIDGKSDKELFRQVLTGVETFATPVIARVTDDAIPDIWLSFDQGTFPSYTANRHVLFDGKDGSILFDEVLGTMGPSGHVAADLNGDGLDELIVGTNRSVDSTGTTEDTLSAPMQYALYWFDPVLRELHAFSEGFNRPAMSTPLLEDLDGDGDLELVLVTSDVGQRDGTYRIERFELHAQKPETPYHGAYMGARFDGRWNPR